VGVEGATDARQRAGVRVIIDGNAQQVILPEYRTADAVVTTRTHKLGAGVHEITVMRSSEALFGITPLAPLHLRRHAAAPKEYARRIEVIGDSITCGYGNEGPNATCRTTCRSGRRRTRRASSRTSTSRDAEHLLSYTSIAARKLSARPRRSASREKAWPQLREQGVGEARSQPQRQARFRTRARRSLSTTPHRRHRLPHSDLASDPTTSRGSLAFNERLRSSRRSCSSISGRTTSRATRTRTRSRRHQPPHLQGQVQGVPPVSCVASVERRDLPRRPRWSPTCSARQRALRLQEHAA